MENWRDRLVVILEDTKREHRAVLHDRIVLLCCPDPQPIDLKAAVDELKLMVHKMGIPAESGLRPKQKYRKIRGSSPWSAGKTERDHWRK
jgi:hypothetical protein